MKKIMDLNQPIRRSFQLLDLKADETESGIIEGHPAVYDQAASIGNYFIEIIERGAFNNCDFDDVLFSVNHDLDRIPLARSRRNNKNSTMQIGPDDIGLGIRAKIDIEKNVEAQSLYSAIQRGDIDGMSFIFYVASDNWENLDTEFQNVRLLAGQRVLHECLSIFNGIVLVLVF
jgi:hypothetical protein